MFFHCPFAVEECSRIQFSSCSVAATAKSSEWQLLYARRPPRAVYQRRQRGPTVAARREKNRSSRGEMAHWTLHVHPQPLNRESCAARAIDAQLLTEKEKGAKKGEEIIFRIVATHWPYRCGNAHFLPCLNPSPTCFCVLDTLFVVLWKQCIEMAHTKWTLLEFWGRKKCCPLKSITIINRMFFNKGGKH